MFSIYCDNKGCGKQQEPMLDLDTNEVICSECGKPIKCVTQFAKVQMRALGQIKRSGDRQKAFSVKCPHCEKEGQPKCGDGDKLLCSICGKELDHLSKPYKSAVLEYLRTHSGS